MIIGILNETALNNAERRVAIIPLSITPLTKKGHSVIVESGAGSAAGYPDQAYIEKGATVTADRAQVIAQAEVIVMLAWPAGQEARQSLLPCLKAGKTLIAQLDPLSPGDAMPKLAATGATAFSLELVPRITRAQAMDVLSSMASVAGYKAVILAAVTASRLFPMMTTAAGTIAAARVFIIGAGVAGLQAIATARRLGSVVTAYDVRPAAREQVESLGAKFAELPLDTAGAEDKGGYAKAMDEAQLAKQRELMTRLVAENSVIITTAAVPGKKAPILITKEMVAAMKPGTVMVDLAAERGGNCELTRPGETVEINGVTILGPIGLPATVPADASQMFSQNIVSFMTNLIKKADAGIDWEDQIVTESLVCKEGAVVNSRVKQAAGIE